MTLKNAIFRRFHEIVSRHPLFFFKPDLVLDLKLFSVFRGCIGEVRQIERTAKDG